MSITYALIFIKSSDRHSRTRPRHNWHRGESCAQFKISKREILWWISLAKPGNNHTIPEDYT